MEGEIICSLRPYITFCENRITKRRSLGEHLLLLISSFENHFGARLGFGRNIVVGTVKCGDEGYHRRLSLVSSERVDAYVSDKRVFPSPQSFVSADGERRDGDYSKASGDGDRYD